MFGIFFTYTVVSITQYNFKDLKIFPSKFSPETNKYNDHHSHGHANDNEGLFNDSIIMQDHGVNETLHFRKLS